MAYCVWRLRFFGGSHAAVELDIQVGEINFFRSNHGLREHYTCYTLTGGGVL